eukprot:748533-Hanusia_phi.AAC.1
MEVDELDGLGLCERSLRVDQQVEEGVDPLQLIVCYGSNGLLAHGALVGVARRLVVVRVRDETRTCAHDGERIDLQVGRPGADAMLVQGDEGVVLFVDVEVLDEPLLEEVGEGAAVAEHLLDVLVGHKRPAVLDDDERATDSTAVARDVDSPLPSVGVDGDELSQTTPPSHCSEKLYEVLR